MGATSVTGRGVGSAESTAKGPKERNFVGVEKLIGPRNMLAVQVTLAAGAATYTFPEVLDGGATDYNVFTQADNAVTVTKNVDGDGDLESVTLAGVGADVVDLLIVKVGIAI
jgi:hypothetical protein